MLIQQVKDITTVNQGIIIQGCNSVGRMGSGVAKAIRNKWPQVFLPYYHFCSTIDKNDRQSALGVVVFVEITPTLIIANGITQIFYGADGKRYANLDAIHKVLYTVGNHSVNSGMLPIYLPKIGSGLGGLDWDTEVLPIVEQFAYDMPDIDVHVCSQ
jgi:O-acetyl-ADP-ribose deacetylase (regulator of RNase III)